MHLTPPIAKSLALVMLGVTLIWTRYEMRSIPASAIPLEALSTRVGLWKCTATKPNNAYGAEVKTLGLTFRGPGGRNANVLVQGTYTRLGALRDWSLARSTGGWDIANETQRELPAAQGKAPVTVRLQDLAKGEAREAAVTLYMSRDRQAASLGKAEVSAWRDRLLGHKMPWLSLFVVVPSANAQDHANAQNNAIELAQDLAYRLQSIAVEADTR